MTQSYDVVIIGGAVIGSAVAYFLTESPDFDGSVLIIERDPSFAKASTSLSASSIRNQFSNPINVRIGQFGTAFIREFADRISVDGERPDLGFHEGGYPFLASTDAQAQFLRENHAVQTELGADVVLWSPDDLRAAFPHLRADDLQLASYGRSGEGWFSNTGLMNGFRKKARAQGGGLSDRRGGGDIAGRRSDHRCSSEKWPHHFLRRTGQRFRPACSTDGGHGGSDRAGGAAQALALCI